MKIPLNPDLDQRQLQIEETIVHPEVAPSHFISIPLNNSCTLKMSITDSRDMTPGIIVGHLFKKCSNEQRVAYYRENISDRLSLAGVF